MISRGPIARAVGPNIGQCLPRHRRAVNDVTYPSAADGFAAAVASLDSWGISFGGGSFFANGVGTPTGSAVFTLKP